MELKDLVVMDGQELYITKRLLQDWARYFENKFSVDYVSFSFNRDYLQKYNIHEYDLDPDRGFFFGGAYKGLGLPHLEAMPGTSEGYYIHLKIWDDSDPSFPEVGYVLFKLWDVEDVPRILEELWLLPMEIFEEIRKTW